jgi:hypothetical protein
MQDFAQTTTGEEKEPDGPGHMRGIDFHLFEPITGIVGVAQGRGQSDRLGFDQRRAEPLEFLSREVPLARFLP